jgi:hypothetical protein
MRLITTLTRKTKFVQQQQQQTLLPKLRLQRHQKSAHQSRHENGPFLHTHPNFEGSIGVIFMGLLFFFFSHSTAKKIYARRLRVWELLCIPDIYTLKRYRVLILYAFLHFHH